MEASQKLLRLSFIQIFRGRGSGCLVRDYFFFSAILISSGLMTSGLLEIYFRYYESQQSGPSTFLDLKTSNFS
jgi:hypothetical protein